MGIFEKFPKSVHYIGIYGMKKLQDSTIIVCSIVRDAEKGLIHNIPVINQLCSLAKDYRIIVYENDSKDRTKQILTDWSNECPEKIHVSLNVTGANKPISVAESANGVNPFFSRKRISKMAMLRNKYMQYIDDNNWVSDYIIVVDLDVSQLYLATILSSFASDIEWDAVCAFGYSLSPKLKRRFHDTYALFLYGTETEPQTEIKIKQNADFLVGLCGYGWLKVASAFGGLAIYRFEAIKGLRYQVIDNDDSRVEVRCEHYSIYKQMKERGYDRFYINPDMTLKYQSLTLKIVFNSLYRRLQFLLSRINHIAFR